MPKWLKDSLLVVLAVIGVGGFFTLLAFATNARDKRDAQERKDQRTDMIQRVQKLCGHERAQKFIYAHPKWGEFKQMKVDFYRLAGECSR